MADTDIAPKKKLVVALNSKRLRSASYDAETRKLTIWSGRFSKIVHRGISPGVYSNLITAQTPDFYYFHYIHHPPPPRKPALRRWIVLLVLLLLVTLLWGLG